MLSFCALEKEGEETSCFVNLLGNYVQQVFESLVGVAPVP
jgi:hypothetical protein